MLNYRENNNNSLGFTNMIKSEQFQLLNKLLQYRDSMTEFDEREMTFLITLVNDAFVNGKFRADIF